MSELHNEASPTLEDRIRTLTESIFEKTEARYARESGVEAYNDGDDGKLTYTVDEAMGLRVALHYSAGGYAYRFGVNQWVEISVGDTVTAVETSYEHPDSYSYSVSENKKIIEGARAEQIVEYSEHVMAIVNADIARKGLSRQKAKATRELKSLYPWTNLEIDSLTYEIGTSVDSSKT